MNDPHCDLAKWFQAYWDQALPTENNADLFEQCGLDGDDAVGFMNTFTTRFGIDASSYRWYFHHGEEGMNFGACFFAPPNRRVQRLAITPAILLQAIETRQWPITYPTHELPTVRWDLRVNKILLVIPALLLALQLWQR